MATLVLALAGSGCGEDADGDDGGRAIVTADPAAAFAPVVELAPDEPWQPMSARWFLERSIFRFAEDEGCADRDIAVGHTLPELQNPTIDWIYPTRLGGPEPTYYRNPYDARCRYDFDKLFHSDQLTRPYDPGPRVEGIRAGEGYYLDLVDAARTGPRRGTPPTYFERVREGDGRVRISYWMLFGMHGLPGRPRAHEGDWVSIGVLLTDRGDRRYEPVAVQVDEAGPRREVEWDATTRVGGTHPVVRLTRASHSGRVAGSARACPDCRRVRTWNSLVEAEDEPWHGFGGAWGELGTSHATTGPLGPHPYWMSAEEKARQLEELSGAGVTSAP